VCWQATGVVGFLKRNADGDKDTFANVNNQSLATVSRCHISFKEVSAKGLDLTKHQLRGFYAHT
jgi:hypothetical protein